MMTLGATLAGIAQTSHLFPQVRKDEVSPGDWLIIRTVKSEYRLRALGDGFFDQAIGLLFVQ